VILLTTKGAMVKRWSVTDGQRETHHVSHKQPTNQSRAMQRDTDTTNHMLRGVTQIKPTNHVLRSVTRIQPITCCGVWHR